MGSCQCNLALEFLNGDCPDDFTRDPVIVAHLPLCSFAHYQFAVGSV
jgi:hypothetical protein